MADIKENFRTIIAKQKALNYHFPNILREPASVDNINKAEEQLGLTFNAELRALYLFADGTDTDSVTPSGLTGLIPIHNFLSLDDAITYYYQSMEFQGSFHNWSRNFMPGLQLFPFLEDGAGNCYWVDLNEHTPGCGKIYWTNTFGTDPDYTYDSLGIMFEVIAEAYTRNIIFLDDNGYLDCDFEAFDQLSEKKR